MCFGYADDITILCPSLAGLKQTLNVCEDFAKEYIILFDASKSKLMYFGKIILMGSMLYICLTVVKLITLSNVYI